MTVTLEVLGRHLQARPDENLLEVLRRAGFVVPGLCHLSGLSPSGACRLCLIEVERGGRRRLTTACNHPVLDGLRVHLDTDRVQRARRGVIELLLTLAPADPGLLELAARYGVPRGRLIPSPAALDHCILCGLCTRVCRERARAEALVFSGRGVRRALATRPFGEHPESCIGCGACAAVCPTGAVSMEEVVVERLRARFGRTRPCRYALMGLTPGALCESDYRCATCEVDQRMVDLAQGRHPVFLEVEP